MNEKDKAINCLIKLNSKCLKKNGYRYGYGDLILGAIKTYVDIIKDTEKDPSLNAEIGNKYPKNFNLPCIDYITVRCCLKSRKSYKLIECIIKYNLGYKWMVNKLGRKPDGYWIYTNYQ